MEKKTLNSGGNLKEHIRNFAQAAQMEKEAKSS